MKEELIIPNEIELERIRQRFRLEATQCNKPWYLGGFRRKRYLRAKKRHEEELREYWRRRFGGDPL